MSPSHPTTHHEITIIAPALCSVRPIATTCSSHASSIDSVSFFNYWCGIIKTMITSVRECTDSDASAVPLFPVLILR